MKAGLLVAAAEAAGLDVRSYSGRGMYGRKCVGIDIDTRNGAWLVATQLALAIVEMSDDPGLDIAELADLDVHTDSMGLGTIVYFPTVAWDPVYDEDEEEEDDEPPNGSQGARS